MKVVNRLKKKVLAGILALIMVFSAAVTGYVSKAEEGVAEAEITTFDFYDIANRSSMTITEHSDAIGNRWGQSLGTGRTENMSVKMQVDTGEATSGAYKLGLCKSNGSNLWDGAGYYFEIDLTGTITFYRGNDWSHQAGVTIPTGEPYVLEYGIVNITNAGNTVMAKRIFVKINNVEVYSYTDKDMTVTCGDQLSIYSDVLPITLSTVISEATPIQYDFYDITNQSSMTITAHTDAIGNRWGQSLGTGRTENMSVKMQVDTGEATSGTYKLGLCKSNGSNLWDGAGYYFEINLAGTITFYRGDAWSGQAGVTIPTGEPYVLEYGIVNITDASDNSVMAKRIFIKINNVEVYSYTDEDMSVTCGDQLSIYSDVLPITLSTVMNDTPVPTGLTDLTWEDFGITCIGEHTADPANGVYGQYGTLTSSKEMNNTLFSGDITMQVNSHIKYIGAVDYIGLMVGVNRDGDLTLSTTGVSAEYLAAEKVFSAELFGLTTFENTRFNLKIAITDFTTSSATIGIWVNDQMVGDYFTLAGVGDYILGSCMALSNGTMQLHSSIVKPTGLTPIFFGDWNSRIYDDNYLSNNDLNGTVHHSEVDTLINTSLKENIKFTGPGANEEGQYLFGWGGLKEEGKSWYGLLIDFVGDTIKLYNKKTDESRVNSFTLTAETLGIDDFSFYDREYLWQVDITQLGNNVLVWMYFDGILYGEAPIVIPNLASEMSDTLLFYPMPQVNGTSTERPAKLGASERTLSDLYHNLDTNAYVIPKGVITMQKKDIKDGVETWTDMAVKGGYTITEAGDYRITYNDGVSNYVQEVVLWRSGDTKINNQNAVGAADLVRLIKQTKEGVDVAYKCEEWAYDVNGDYTVDTETDSMKNVEVVTLREMILGSYKEDTSDKMPIVGHVGPTGSAIKEENYQEIQKLGITLIIESGSERSYSDVPMNRYYIYEQLTLAQKYGIKMTVPDQRLIDMRTETVEAIQAYLPKAIENYKNYQSFGGLFIVDEPVTTNYPPTYLSKNPTATKHSEYINLAQAVNSMEVDGQKLFGYSNGLFYCYDHVNDPTSPYKYVNYLDNVVNDYQGTFVSATYYPFFREHIDVPDEGSAKNGSDYFMHLALNRYVANEAEKPFWTFVQAGDSFELAKDDLPLTEGEFKWSANMGLAFGAKGLQYFSLVQPTISIFHQSTMGLLDFTGEKTEYYDWAVDVNKQITAVDHILMNATHKGIMTTGTYATTQAANNVREIKLYQNYIGDYGYNSQGNARVEVYNDSGYQGATVTCGTDSEYGTLTGCFETVDGKHALFIVNYNPETANEVTVNVGSGVAATVIHEGNTTQAIGSANITLEAGEAAVVVY